VTVADAFPGGLVLLSATPSLGSYPGDVWTVGTVSPGASPTLTFIARVVSTSPQTNTARITHADQFDPDPTNNSASATETPQQADLALAKAVSNPTPNVGDTVTFTITISNHGPDSATNVAVHDLLPAGLAFVSATPSQGTYNSGTGVWEVGTVAPGPQTLQIEARVVSPDPQTNTATISHADQFDPDAGNNSASATETPQRADLVVTRSVSNPTPNVGDTVTFSVTLTNRGPDAATGVELTDRLPAGLIFVSASATQGSYDPATGLWAIGTVAPGTTQTLAIRAQVVRAASVPNVVVVSHADQFDPDLTNNTATATVSPLPVQAVLHLVKLTAGADNESGLGPLLPVGATVTWTYLVSNPGDVPLAGVTVTDSRPGVTPAYQSGDANSNGVLDPGETWVYTATGTVTAGPYSNTGTVSATDFSGTTPALVTASDSDRYFGVRQTIPVVPPTTIGKIDLLDSTGPGGASANLMGQAAFVSALYEDLLGRPADAAGVNYQVNLLQAGMTRAQVVQGVWQLPEHRSEQVDGLYRALLHRPADPAALAYWGALLQAGESEEQVAAGILASAEYTAAHPDAASFVGGLYADVLGRAADAAGASYWKGLLAAGASRQEVAAEVLASPDALGLALARDYAAYLRRPLDATGRQYWMPLAMASPGSADPVALGILASDEYFQTAGRLARA
jgi:uncharacterized repeat protein (TIGR01451 family)